MNVTRVVGMVSRFARSATEGECGLVGTLRIYDQTVEITGGTPPVNPIAVAMSGGRVKMNESSPTENAPTSNASSNVMERVAKMLGTTAGDVWGKVHGGLVTVHVFDDERKLNITIGKVN